MKIITLTLTILIAISGRSFVYGGEGHGSQNHDGESHSVSESALEVGNKICPVSGEVIADEGDGKGIQIEHDGKIYNLCCSMCAKDFKKSPDKFIQKINEELENSNHGDHDEDHAKGSHRQDHGDHDH